MNKYKRPLFEEGEQVYLVSQRPGNSKRCTVIIRRQFKPPDWIYRTVVDRFTWMAESCLRKRQELGSWNDKLFLPEGIKK